MSQEQIQSQVMKSQGYAVEIEWILRNVFECDRCGFGGQVDADHVRKHPYLSMTQGLAYLYAIHPEKRASIDKFVESFSFYSDMSLDDILSFDTNEKVSDMCTIQIEKDNGLEQIEYMIAEFKKVVE